LACHPYIALDQIDFRREHISDAKLKANVRLTLFLRPVPRGDSAATTLHSEAR